MKQEASPRTSRPTDLIAVTYDRSAHTPVSLHPTHAKQEVIFLAGYGKQARDNSVEPALLSLHLPEVIAPYRRLSWDLSILSAEAVRSREPEYAATGGDYCRR